MTRPWPFKTRGGIVATVLVVVAIAAAIVLVRLPKRSTALASVATETVERRDITVTVEATGTVEPINLIEVKSKASGQITKMPVEVGTRVRAGDLLVQIDPRDVESAYQEAQAAVVASQARAKVAGDQRQRSDELFQNQVITATEHEAAQLEEANAKSALVGARSNLEQARQRRDDARVTAPVAGTILATPVSNGTVISSATSSASGGTTILQMADLSRIRMRALVAETDIGKVRENLPVTVVVDAFPQRNFQGVVEKIEPQAVVQQSVTMFPVLVSISNEDGSLLPGMNGEVTMLVDRRTDVLSVPADALRGMREFAALAPSLGMNADSLRSRAMAAAADGSRMESMGASMSADSVRGGAGEGRRRGGAGGGRDSAMARRMRGGGAGAGADVDPERAARWRQRMAQQGGGSGGAGAAGPSGAAGGANSGGGRGGAGMRGGGASRMQVAVVKTANGLTPRLVRTGLNNYDYVEVLDGLNEGDAVVLFGVLDMQRQRDQMVSRVRQGAGAGLVGGTAGGGSGTRTGGGAGGGGGGR